MTRPKIYTADELAEHRRAARRAWNKTAAGREQKARYQARKRLRDKLVKIHAPGYLCPLLTELEQRLRKLAHLRQQDAWAAARKAKQELIQAKVLARQEAKEALAREKQARKDARAEAAAQKNFQKDKARAFREALAAAKKVCPVFTEPQRLRNAAAARKAVNARKDANYAAIKAVPAKRLGLLFANAMRKSLRTRRSCKKGVSWERLLPYGREQLKAHLESLFLPGMSWENYGEWHIDHKIPKVWWEYSSPEDPEFQQCWALANLQPLWAKDNHSKHARFC